MRYHYAWFGESQILAIQYPLDSDFFKLPKKFLKISETSILQTDVKALICDNQSINVDIASTNFTIVIVGVLH